MKVELTKGEIAQACANFVGLKCGIAHGTDTSVDFKATIEVTDGTGKLLELRAVVTVREDDK